MRCLLLLVFLVPAVLAACAQRGTPLETPASTTLLDDPTDPLPAKLSEIGLFVDPVRELPSDRVIPYQIRYPLYSDYNEKSRYLFLPPGKKIDTSNPRQWRFPIGTLLFKTFYLTTLGNHSSPRRKIETRVLQRRTDGWHTAAYQWNASGSEAFLTDGNEVRLPFILPGGNYVYTIPDRFSCRVCHQSQPDFVIGFEAVRLSSAGDDVLRQQMQDLVARGIFSPPFDDATAEIPGPALEKEAIGYLHGNCANCHNPSSPIYLTSDLDLRYWRIKATTINVLPTKFTSGDSSLFRLTPGNPEKSLLYLLMARTYPDTAQFMPPLGTSMIDTVGLQTVKRWIESL